MGATPWAAYTTGVPAVRPEGERLLIFSRKGFDSSFGGWPSPRLPDGRLVSVNDARILALAHFS
jgi:Nucleotide modification associated domain 3